MYKGKGMAAERTVRHHNLLRGHIGADHHSAGRKFSCVPAFHAEQESAAHAGGSCGGNHHHSKPVGRSEKYFTTIVKRCIIIIWAVPARRAAARIFNIRSNPCQ